MTAKEYDIIAPTHRNIINWMDSYCNDNGITYPNYGCFVEWRLSGLQKAQALVKTIEGLDFTDPYKLMVILNKRDIQTKQDELVIANEKVDIAKAKLSEWLDDKSNPYMFILHPVYEFGANIGAINNISKIDGYRKVYYTGITDENIGIAFDYAMLKINKFIEQL